MKKKLYLTMMLLLPLAGNIYADDDPSVVTLLEQSFENGMGDFISKSTVADWGIVNSAWHYNPMQHCIEYSGTVPGCLISPLIPELADKKYYDIKLIFECAGENVTFSDFSILIGKDKFPSYEEEMYDITLPTSLNNYITNSSINLNKYCHGKESRIVFDMTNRYGEDNKCFRIKNLKIVARDWTKVEDVARVSTIEEVCSLPNNTPAIISYDNMMPTWSDNDGAFLSDGKNVYVISYYGSNHTINRNDLFSGEAYGYVVKDNGFTYFRNSSFTLTSFSYNVGNVTYDNPIVITDDDDILSNLGRYVQINVESPIKVYDKFGWHGSKVYTPKYDTTFRGMVLKNDNGEYYYWSVGMNSFELTLPDNLTEVPQLGDNERGFDVVIGRQFEVDKWYSICLPCELPNRYVFGTGRIIATLTSSENGNLCFTTGAQELPMGEPALIKFTDASKMQLKGCVDNLHSVVAPNSVEVGDYKMVGTLSQVTPDSPCYYLAAENTIKPLAEDGRVSAFRAYFEPNIQSSARTLSVSGDGNVIATGEGTTTNIEDILKGQSTGNGEVFNLNGQKVRGNGKGIYIINGKKIIK